MAKKTGGKKADTHTERTRMYLSPRSYLATKLRLAAASIGVSETEMLERLIEDNLSSVHVRGLPVKYANETNGETDPDRAGGAAPPSVQISKKLMDRFSDIHTRSTKPVDDAINGLVNDENP